MKYIMRKKAYLLKLCIKYFSIFELRYSIFRLAILLLLLPCELLAIGISATPATLFARAAVGKEAVVRFTVTNPSKEVGLFETYPEEFEDAITLVPSRFILEAGEKREVIVRARGREEGIIRTVVAVEARPLGEPEHGIGGGVRVPFSLEVSSQNNQLASLFASGFYSMPVFIGALLLFLLLFLWRREILSFVRRKIKTE